MKRMKLFGAVLCSLCLTAGSVTPAMADSMKVVTLGADLSEEQKNTMMKYFKVDSSQVQILTITNQDERDHLSAYVPLEQIGTRTVSCAYVKPTQSGGIKVRTANLNWVTGNMIATTLSTSGVKNCEVVAACPFEVSGTGALTGIQMAYETATGEKLDDTKKKIATEEMVVTGKIADDVGKNDATTVINKSKMEVLQNNVENADDIYNIVINIAQQNNVGLSSDQIDQIVSLLQEIAQQNYDYDDMKATLERVDENTSGELGEVAEETDDTVEAGESADGDSIVSGLDESILGDSVVASSTEDPELEVETGLDDSSMDTYDTEMSEYDMSGDDEMSEDGWEELPQDETVDTAEEGDSQKLDTSSLTEEQTELFDKAKKFCTGEYEGDAAALQSVMGEDAYAEVVLDPESGSALSKEVEKAYLDILVKGTDSYVADGTEMYMSTELNMLDKALQDIFGLNMEVQASPSLIDTSDDEKMTLYKDTMKFFEKLYGESSESYETEDAQMGGTEDSEYYEEDSEAEYVEE